MRECFIVGRHLDRFDVCVAGFVKAIGFGKQRVEQIVQRIVAIMLLQLQKL